MRLSVFIILVALFSAYGIDVYSQSAKITLEQDIISVEKLISTIEEQTKYLFVYNKNNVDVKQTVKVSGNNKPVSDILNEAFIGTGISYVVEGKNIVLTRINNSLDLIKQNNIKLKGVVLDSQNEPIIGAYVLEQGTSNGTTTDLDGCFTLSADSQSILLVSMIGYKDELVPINGRNKINIVIYNDVILLDKVVVTAMGLIKKEASLTYAAQQIGGNELTRAQDANMINALAGKTAGVQITRNSSGLGGSAKVSIRGIRSANENGNNQPLYVIDGVPILNSTTEQSFSVIGGDNDAGNRDSGDGISNINAEDIESMTILKGASAAALYGSQAANGVILITTKKGQAGVQRVPLSSSTTIDNVIDLPKFQNNYARTNNGSTTSWGAKSSITPYDNLKDYYNTGFTTINSLTVQTGKEKSQTYFSYSNTYAQGVVNVNKLVKNNFTIRETASLFNDKVSLDGNASLITQNNKNRPTSGGYYMNPLSGLYTFPRGMDISTYKDNFEMYDQTRNMPLQNWYTSALDFEQNPYWIINRVTSSDIRYRAIAGVTLNVKATDWLSVQARGNIDYINDKFKQKFYASTALNLAHENGRYIDMNSQEFLMYGDIMALFNKSWNNWSLNGAIGGAYSSNKTNYLKLDSGKGGLYYANIFTVANMILGSAGESFVNESINLKRVVQSVFGTAQIGWKNYLFLDISARNDWSSTLANTQHKNKGFFYPSFGVSWIINKSLKMPEWITFSKIRASLSKVGNDLPIGITSPFDLITAGGGITSIQYGFDDKLKPEMSTSYEIGSEWKFFNNRFDIDFTYYRTDTENQLLYVNDPVGRYPYKYINAGKIRNSGIELTVGGTPILGNGFSWRTNINFSKNKNKVVSLGGYESFDYGTGVSMPYRMRVVEGGSLGDIYGNKFQRDNDGNIELGLDGLPIWRTGCNDYIGNTNPDWLLGWSNTLAYKGFSFYFLIDTRKGGSVVSLTQAALDLRGVSANTGVSRDVGFVKVDNQLITNIQSFYEKAGDRASGNTEFYTYNGTNIRMREISIGYSFPQRILEKTRIFKGIDINIIGRNLFFFYKDAPFDPDMIMSIGNANQGVEIFGMPATRNVGFNIKFTF